MPQVPYDPVSQVAAEDARIQRPQVEAPPAAFGTNIAEGVRQVGAVGAQVGDETFRTALWLQNLNNESTARDVSIQATQEMAQRASEFDSLEGKARHDALPQYLKDLNDIRIKYRSKLNPVASKMFDAEAASLQNRFTAQGALRAGEGLKQFATETARSHADVISNTWADPFDDKEAEAKHQQIASAVRTVVENSPGGFSEDAFKDALQKRYSQLWFDRINIVSQTNVGKAFDMLDQARRANEILPNAEKAIYDQLVVKNRTQGADYIVKTNYDRGKTLSELEDITRKAAKDPTLSRGDEQFEKAAVDAMSLRYNQDHHAEVMDRAGARQLLDDSVHTGNFRTEADVRANPELQHASELDPSFDITKALKAYWGPRDAAASKATYDKLWGEADQRPLDFLKEDLWDHPELIDKDRAKLMMMRKAIIKASGSLANDPNVDKASKTIRGIFFNSVPASGTTDYEQWLGALSGALEDYQAGVQRKLGHDDYEKIGRVLLSQVEGGGWFGSNVQAPQVYDAPVESTFLDHYREQGMPDDEIATLYHRTLAVQKFNRLFSGGLKVGGPKE